MQACPDTADTTTRLAAMAPAMAPPSLAAPPASSLRGSVNELRPGHEHGQHNVQDDSAGQGTRARRADPQSSLTGPPHDRGDSRSLDRGCLTFLTLGAAPFPRGPALHRGDSSGSTFSHLRGWFL